MLKRHFRRVALGAVVLVLLTSGTAAVMTGSSTQRAAAICTGVGQPLVISGYDTNGTVVAQEGAVYPGTTCNGDYQYAGAVLDPITDGSCAYAYYLELFAYYGIQATSCTTGAWVFYSYIDSIGTNSVFVSPRASYTVDNWRLSSGY